MCNKLSITYKSHTDQRYHAWYKYSIVLSVKAVNLQPMLKVADYNYCTIACICFL